jgi:hypothetical protein
MAISGFVVYAFGVKVAFAFDAFMFFVGFILLYRLEIEVEFIKSGEKLLVMMGDTFTYLKKFPHAIHLMILHAFIGLSAFDALVALMVSQYYAGVIAVSLALGLLHAFRAFGLVLGPILLSKFANNRYLFYIFIAQGVAVSIWAFFMSEFYLSLIASILVGLFTTTLWSYTYTLLQKNIDKKYYGRVVAYNDMLFLSVASFTSFMIGYLAKNNFSLESIAIMMACGFILGGVYFRWIIKTQNIKDIS